MLLLLAVLFAAARGADYVRTWTLFQVTTEYTLPNQQTSITTPRVAYLISDRGTSNTATYPGPTVTVNVGDRITVTIVNNLPEETSIHFHGFHQINTPWHDGAEAVTQCPIPANGGTYTYDFVADMAGTFWYHSHVSTQYEKGLLGIVNVVDPTQTLGTYMHTNAPGKQVIMISDWYKDVVNRGDHLFLANGQTGASNLLATMPYGASSLMLFSFINGGGYSGAPQLYVEIDGVNVWPHGLDGSALYFSDGSWGIKPVRSFFFGIGERIDVFIPTSGLAQGCYRVRVGISPDVLSVVGFIQYGTGGSCVAPALDSYGSIIMEPVFDTSAPGTAVAAVMGSYSWPSSFPTPIPIRSLKASVSSPYYYIQETSSGSTAPWTVPTVPLLFNAGGCTSAGGSPRITLDPTTTDTWQDVVVYSPSNHPLHFHGHSFYLLGMGTGQFTGSNAQMSSLNLVNPLRKDTINMNGGWAYFRFKVDNPGLWLFHCHLNDHMMKGMAIVFNILPSRQIQPPLYLPRTCVTSSVCGAEEQYFTAKYYGCALQTGSSSRSISVGSTPVTLAATYPGLSYQNNVNCLFSLVPVGCSANQAKWSFSFSKFNTELNYDFLSLKTALYTWVGQTSGTTAPTVPTNLVSTTTDPLKVLFTSDYSITKPDGFVATVSRICVSNSMAAGGEGATTNQSMSDKATLGVGLGVGIGIGAALVLYEAVRFRRRRQVHVVNTQPQALELQAVQTTA